MNKILIPLFLLLSLEIFLWSESPEIKIITYHTHAPFILGDSTGLTYDLAEYLSENTEYNFTVEQMSRPRIDSLLSQNYVAIIPWINPAWFDDIEEEKFMWSDFVMMKDNIAYISSITAPFDYRGPDSLKKHVLGGITGHKYVNIDEFVESGEMKRYDSVNHIDNYKKLLMGSIDFTITPASGANYIIKENNMSQSLYLSFAPNSFFDRKIIISHGDPQLKKILDNLFSDLSDDSDWKSIIDKYRTVDN